MSASGSWYGPFSVLAISILAFRGVPSNTVLGGKIYGGFIHMICRDVSACMCYRYPEVPSCMIGWNARVRRYVKAVYHNGGIENAGEEEKTEFSADTVCSLSVWVTVLSRIYTKCCVNHQYKVYFTCIAPFQHVLVLQWHMQSNNAAALKSYLSSVRCLRWWWFHNHN